MFVEPSLVQDDWGGLVLHGCPRCPMRVITLLLTVKPEGKSVEHTLLVCGRLSTAYLADLYALYTGRDLSQRTGGFVTPTTNLFVDTFLEPNDWLHCLVYSRYQKVGGKASLEMFVKRPNNSEFYYAIGEDLVMSKTTGNTIQVHASTLQILSGKSNMYCEKPQIVMIDEGNKLAKEE